ncbi:unnamed protein product [Caenorhabditis angaria]|uniref:Uncharacterized protein n=1 Tax=Caenorhabditis angaria TaxID=860376 RepID=A0A9P1I9S5_9PELO|nr:unnamed protein product [Caenorhabditis angaria]
MRRISLLLVVYEIFDWVITLTSFGFFAPSFVFNSTQIISTITFEEQYHFTTSPFDFFILLLIRQLLIFVAVILQIFNNDQAVKKLFIIVSFSSIFTYSFSLVKFLAFSEDTEFLYYPGVWSSVGWALISSTSLVGLWYFILSNNQFNYQRLINNVTPEYSSESENSNSNSENVENGTSTPPRVPLHKHLMKLFSYCGQQWQWFLLGFIFLNIYAVARVFIPSYTAQVIADIVNKRGLSALIHSVLVLCVLTGTSSFFGGLRGGSFDYATALVSNRVRLDLFTSLVNQDISFFDTTKTGETMSRLTSDCQTISSTVSTNVNVFLRNGVMLIGALVFMFVMSWRLAMKISEKLQETIANANQMAEEILSTMRTVRSFACEKREVNRFHNHLDSTLSVNRKRAIAYMGYTWNNEFCDNAILVAVLFYGGHLVMTDKMAKEELITFLLYQMQLGENLYNLSYVISGLMEAVGASRKVFELMNRQPQFALDGLEKPIVNGNIRFENVSFNYPSRPNNPVLKDLTLNINAGETVALVGPSGGGKSSIVSLIEHFYEPNSGKITLDNIEVRDINHVYYHQKIALVAQEPILYEGSVRHNILYGCDFATEDDMLKAAEMANVHEFVKDLEKGYDTNCGEKGVQMSGGQKQRIAIARALVRNPAVLILDEATSALDAESEALVQQALNRCAKERTVLIIAHRLSTIEKADKIAVISKGTLVQTGSHRELMNDQEGLYYSLVSRQILNAKVDGDDAM